ncbi:MAG: GTP cyclohydrolase II [Gemmatimonadetes bacterium]|nr:GTP cyclohydrolase II [Gemmatimonadota bacterium]
MHKVERALFEMRQGRALCVTGGDGWTVVAAVEGLGVDRLGQFRSLGGSLRLIVTQHRGEVMGLANADGSVLSLGLGVEAPDSILLLATAPGTPAVEMALRSDVRMASASESSALSLARRGRLLPALVSTTVDSGTAELRRWLEEGAILDVSISEIERAAAHPGIEVTYVTEAPVPLADAEHSRFVFFRERGGFLEHVAVLIGARDGWPDPVPVRLHSACLTGDLFGSLRCDCGEQLRGSLRHFAARGGGVLIYLAQEGRGIGLGNKMRAYALQEGGLDTVDADGTLGFGADERRYDAAVAILRDLDITQVQLLTNNPEKVRALEEGGIHVVERMPLHGGLNRHNLRYVQAKVDRSGHWLADMISQPISE